MAISLQLGYPDVPKSVTNPNVNTKNAIDVGYPMAFLVFMKNINVSLEPETLQNYYNFYISKWNTVSSANKNSDKEIIIERYRDFLKDIIIKYSTVEEKKYLSSIDFNDPLDLDIVLGFYSKKLKDLCDFYNKKRTEVKFGILKNKIKGSNIGVSQTIKDLTISYIKNIEDSDMLFDFDAIYSKLEIEIEELYDIHPLYYNQTPDEKIYDNKDLDYGLNIFLKDDEELINEVFSGLSDELKKIKEVDQLFENKRSLTKKYISTDFYYLSTGQTTTQFISGKLFENDNTILNLLNRNYPSTASTSHDNYQTERDRGFFRPHNISFVLLDGVSKSFSFDLESLEPNSLYFFPDPSIITDNTGIIKIVVDDSLLKRNKTSGAATNQPTSIPYDTKYFGYSSKITPNIDKNFDTIFNSGYISDFKYDIYGNSYGLYKKGFQKYIENPSSGETIVSLLFNGYEFNDILYREGYNFNYYTVDDVTFNETIRTGLSTNTGGFTNFTPDLTLKFGKYRPYYQLTPPTDNELVGKSRYVDGIRFLNNDDTPLLDPTSSDLSAFINDTSPFYYSTLIEGGIASNSPQSKALLDPAYPLLSAMFVSYNSLSTNVVTGGSFYDNISYFNITNNKIYINDSINNTEVSPLSVFDEYDGSLFIKNKNTNIILPLIETLPYLNYRYPNDVVQQLNNITKFENVYDLIILETTNYLMFEKIKYENTSFRKTTLPNIYVEHSRNPFQLVSNRFKVDDNIYYFILDYVGNAYNNTLKVYPNIYKYDTTTNINDKIYPPSSPTNYFILSSNIDYVKASSPVLAYSSRNNIFNISFLLKDQNNYPSLHTYDFILNPDVEFISRRDIILSDINNSTTFYNYPPTNLNVFLSASIISSTNDILII